jgi:hypothetical protein
MFGHRILAREFVAITVDRGGDLLEVLAEGGVGSEQGGREEQAGEEGTQ